MKSSKTAGGLALVGILCAGMAMMPGKCWATITECEAYASAAAADDSYEPNNTAAAATQLTNDTWLGAGGDPNCGVMLDEDWYKIDVPAGNTGIFIDLRFKYALGDMDLRLFGTDGTSLLDSHTVNGENATIDYKTALTAGTYYIQVNSGDKLSNRYRLWTHVYMPVAQHTVTSSVPGGNGSVNPSGDTAVDNNGTLNLTLYPDIGYTASRNVMGTCLYGNWADGTHYTTGAITANCTAIFSFGATKVVTSSAGAGGTVEPSGAQDVASGDSRSFIVTANTGYTTDAAVGGSCPPSAGDWNENVYTINPITDDCTVSFSFTGGATTYTVTPSAGTGGSFTPTGAQIVNAGAKKTFTVTADTGYTTNSAVDGTCPAGTWSGNNYTTGAITADCTVNFTFTPGAVTHTVTPSAGAGGSFTPTGAQTVNHNTTKAFTVTANSGYTTNSAVGGTCPAGSWAGNVYTTGAITADCTVSFSFTSASNGDDALPAEIYKPLLLNK